MVVAAAEAGEPARLVARLIQDRGGVARLIAPPRSLSGAWLRAGSESWAEVELGNRGSRLARVTLPAALVGSRSVIAVNTVSSDDRQADPIVIGLWARYAHPRQRTGARLSDARDGLTAEIALAVKPCSILLFSTWRGVPVLAASADQIAAELAGLAMRQLVSGEGEDSIGPWEHPLVQHATELELGVATPGDLRAEFRWCGRSGDPAEADTRDFATNLYARMGVVFGG